MELIQFSITLMRFISCKEFLASHMFLLMMISIINFVVRRFHLRNRLWCLRRILVACLLLRNLIMTETITLAVKGKVTHN